MNPSLSPKTKLEIATTIADGAKTGRWDQDGGNEDGPRSFTTEDGTEVSAARDGELIRAWVQMPGEMVEITEEWF